MMRQISLYVAGLARLTAAATIAAILLAPSSVFAQVLRDFTAVSNGPAVVLQWTTGTEAGVAEFRVQRSFDGVRFHAIHTALPAGSNHNYSYTDDDLFKSRLQTIYYRIEVAYADHRAGYSLVEQVELAFSGIRRTWGSIKAMFR